MVNYFFLINENMQALKLYSHWTKMKFSIKDFSSKCGQIHSFLRIWSHLLKKFQMKNFIFVQCRIHLSNWMGPWKKCLLSNIKDAKYNSNIFS